MQQNIGAVILAAGRGKRLGCTDIPKVMVDLGGKPIVEYVIEKLESLGFAKDHISLVVGFQKEKVKEYFDGRVVYAHQDEQLGTAHAAFRGMKELPVEVEQVIVIGGDDSAFYTAETLERFVSEHVQAGVTLSLLTAEVEDPSLYGRIVRHENGGIEIIEKEYVTEEQSHLKEISTGTFCFDRRWYEENFPHMPPLRKLGEYGLPTALAMAREQGVPHQVVKLEDSSEWFGINTPEELEEGRRLKEITK